MFPFITTNHKKSGDTWNPLGGKCLHACRYCWVNNIKAKFPATKAKYSGESRIVHPEFGRILTFTASDFVFVCDCTDLFGHWVPTELIKQIFAAIKDSPAKYLLLTKNPQRYLQLIKQGVTLPKNCVLGATVESDIDHLLSGQPETQRLAAMAQLHEMGYPVMLSVEPIMQFSPIAFPVWIIKGHPEFVAVGYDNYGYGLPEPSIAETLQLIDNLEAAGITVYRKTLREAHP